MTHLQSLLQQWDPERGEPTCALAKDEFHALARGLFAASAKCLHIPVSGYKIQSDRGGTGQRIGSITFRGPGFYLFLTAMPHGAGVMRTATVEDPYGTRLEHISRNVPFEAIESPTALADAIRALLASKNKQTEAASAPR